MKKQEEGKKEKVKSIMDNHNRFSIGVGESWPYGDTFVLVAERCVYLRGVLRCGRSSRIVVLQTHAIM